MTIGNAIMEPMQVHGILANDEERKKCVEELLDIKKDLLMHL